MVIALLLLVLGVAAGLRLARVAPPLAPTPTGRLAARVVQALLVAAVVALLLNLWLAVDNAAWDLTDVGSGQLFGASVVSALWQSGTLLAAAAAVHLLAPPVDEN